MGRYILHFSSCHGMWQKMTELKYHHHWRGGLGGLGMVPVTGALKGGGSQKGAPTTPPPPCKPFLFHPWPIKCRRWAKACRLCNGDGSRMQASNCGRQNMAKQGQKVV